MQIKGHYF